MFSQVKNSENIRMYDCINIIFLIKCFTLFFSLVEVCRYRFYLKFEEFFKICKKKWKTPKNALSWKLYEICKNMHIQISVWISRNKFISLTANF